MLGGGGGDDRKQFTKLVIVVLWGVKQEEAIFLFRIFEIHSLIVEKILITEKQSSCRT